MKIALISLSLLSLLLAIGWKMDRDSLNVDLCKYQAMYNRTNSELDRQIDLDEKNIKAHSETSGELSSKTTELAEIFRERDAADKEFADEQQQNVALEKELGSLKKAYDSLSVTSEHNYEAAKEWNEQDNADRESLKSLWSYTRNLYNSDTATQQALGDALYMEVTKPPVTPPSYTAVFNGAGFTITPNN